MDERLRGALVNSVQQAGFFLKNPNGSKRSNFETEKRCREIILRGIRNVEPRLSHWGEENEPGRSIAVCPLDSEANFSRSFGPYGVMAAYIEGPRPVLGALFMPEEGIMIIAERGKGARLEGRKLSAGRRDELRSALVLCSCNGYLQADALVPLSLGLISVLSENGVPWRNSGAPSADFFAVSSGRADALVSPMQESAFAAGYLIMEEAGALVTDRNGDAFTLHSQSIVAANKELHGPLLELVQGALG